MTDKRKNAVKSVTKKRGKLTLEFFDNEGKLRQKDTGLVPTKANRTYLWKTIVPQFEKQLQEMQRRRDARSFEYYAEIYLELNKENTKIAIKRGQITHFKNYFGEETLIKDIRLTSVKRFFANQKKADGTTPKRDTKKQWRSTLKGIFQLAVEDGELDFNMIDNWQLPSQNDAPSSKKPFSTEEVSLLLEHSDGVVHNAFGIGIWTGLRPEELVALTVEDIDFENSVIYVRKAFSKYNVKNRNTKTKSSVRTVPIFNSAVPYLKKQIVYANKKKSIYLFCKEDGSMPESSEDITGRKEFINKGGKRERCNGAWYQVRNRAGLPNAQLHCTRHTFAVQCLKSKQFTPQEVAGMMGITLDVLYNKYAKFIDDSHQKVDRSIDIFSA